VIALVAGAILLQGASPLAADSHQAAEEVADQAEFERGWHPEISLGFLLHVQDLKASASANFMDVGAPESDKAISPGFQLGASMISPVLVKSSTFKPRFFVEGGIQYLLEEEYTAYRGFINENVGFNVNTPSPNCDVPGFGRNVKGNGPELAGTLNEVNYPDIDLGLPDLYNNTFPSQSNGIDFDQEASQFYPAGAFGGYALGGSDCNANLRAKTSIDLMWTAGVGFEVTLPVLSRQFHLRMSANYLGQSFGDIRASFDRTSSFDVCTTAATQGGVPFSGCGTSSGVGVLIHPKYTAPQIVGYTSGSGFTTHAVGPRVKIDVDVFKRGDLRMSLFLELGVAWLLGAPESTLVLELPDQVYNCSTETTSAYCGYKAPTAQNPTGEKPQVFYTVSPDNFIAQGGGGIRIVWSPPW
jgi:hypothetical protein